MCAQWLLQSLQTIKSDGQCLTTVCTGKGAQGGRCVTSGTRCAGTYVTRDQGPKVREAPEKLPLLG